MDAAALRGGRFTEKVAFCLPDQATVLDYLTQWQQRSKTRMASDLSLAETARQLAGQPLANVQEILQDGGSGNPADGGQSGHWSSTGKDGLGRGQRPRH